MKSKHASKPTKAQQGILLNVARTIGSTLGTLAGKAGGVSKHPTRSVRAKKIRSKKRVRTRNRRRA